MADLTRYQEQFQAIMANLDTLEKQPQDPNFLGMDRFVQFSQRLRRFAEGQFYFFYHGFSAQPPAGYPKLNPQISADNSRIQFPPEHVLATLLYQIAADATVIQLAAAQRALLATADGEDHFAQLDKNAQASLWKAPSVADEYLEGKKVVTYLADSVQVRVVPYAPVIFIGVPPTLTPSPRTAYTIAHEIGHFRFWHSFPQTRAELANLGDAWAELAARVTDLKLNLRELFYPFAYAQTDEPMPLWAEEIFADVYGALFGGPGYVETAMDMALEHSTRGLLDFALRDRHPTPLLRPLLILKALQELNTARAPLTKPLLNIDSARVTTSALALFNAWKRKLAERGILEYADAPGHELDDTRDLYFRFTDSEIATRVGKLVAWDTRTLDLRFPAEALVLKAVNAMRYAFQVSPPSDILWGWSDNPQAAIQEVTLFFKQVQELQNALQMILIAARHPLAPFHPRTELNPPIESSWDNWQKWALEQKGYFKTIPTDEIYAGEFDTVMNPTTRPSNSWLPVFGAGGWTTEGPCAHPPP